MTREADDSNDDLELRGIAMAAFDHHERTVSPNETEAALAAVRSRIDAGDMGGSSPVLFDEVARQRQRRSPAVMLGAAAAVVGMVSLGLVAVVSGPPEAPGNAAVTAPLPPTGDAQTDGSEFVVVDTEPVASPTETSTPAEAETTDSDAVAVPEEAVPATTLASGTDPGSAPASGGAVAIQTVEVDAAMPPPQLDPTPFATIPLVANVNGNLYSVGIGSDIVGVFQPDTSYVSVVDRASGAVSEIEVDDRLNGVVIGPNNVAYGFGAVVIPEPGEQIPGLLPIVAIALAGERQGEVVATEQLDLNTWLESPRRPIGLGPDGVVGRVRQTNEALIGYVDEAGNPLAWNAAAPPLLTIDRAGNGGLVSTPDAAWNLDVKATVSDLNTYTGPSAPAPTSNGRVMYTDRIGDNQTPEQDFGNYALPVVALLESDGSGQWFSLPDDWDVVASEVWGTVLARTTADTIELALLDDALTAAGVDIEPDSQPPQPPPDPEPPLSIPSSEPAALAIADNCIGDFNCTQLVASESGDIVAYDPTIDAISTYDPTGMALLREVVLADGVADQSPWLVHVGPDDVAYLSVDTGQDAARTMLIVPLLGENAGSAIDTIIGLDGTGDTDLVPGVDGLMAVGCCGSASVRPAVDAMPLLGYVDRNGNPATSQRPTFSIVGDGDAGNELTRIDQGGSTAFWLPTVVSGIRGMPNVVATDDGGALMSIYSQIYQRSFLIDFDTDWPEFGIDASDVYFADGQFGLGAVLLERSGTVIVRDERGNFVRNTLDQVATRGWEGEIAIDEQTGVLTAPGLNDYIVANQPAWASDPELFGLQLSPRSGVNEWVEAKIDGPTGDLIVTTTGLLDDSVQATRLTVDIDRGDDGLYRFASGTYGFQCVVGRGHQDFSLEFCI